MEKGGEDLEEWEAVKRLKRGDEAGLRWLMDRYGAYVHTIVCNIIGSFASEADWEEVASDVFLTLWIHAGRVAPDKVKAFLGGVARNKAREFARKRGTSVPLEEDCLVLTGGHPETLLEEREQARLIQKAVDAMGEPEREIFFRYYYYYEPVTAIAEAMGMKPATIKTKLHRGRKKLKDILMEGGYFVEDPDL